MLHSATFASPATVGYLFSRPGVAALVNERDHYNEDDQLCVCYFDDDVRRTLRVELPHIPAGLLENSGSDHDSDYDSDEAETYTRWVVVKLDRNQDASYWVMGKTWQELRNRVTIKFSGKGAELDEKSLLDLKKAKADYRSMEPDRSPLHYAAAVGNTHLASKLLNHGADLNQRDRFGMTPLHHAAKHGDVDTAELLCRHGADRSLLDNTNSTALQVALDNGPPHLQQLLNPLMH